MRPFVEDARLADPAAARLTGALVAVELRLAVVGSGGARPADVAHWLFGEDVPAIIVRLGFDAETKDGRRVDPLDLEALRVAASGAAAALGDADHVT